MKYSNVSARYVFRLLMPEHKEKILVAATQPLQRYEKNGANILESIVTCDKTYVHCFTMESIRGRRLTFRLTLIMKSKNDNLTYESYGQIFEIQIDSILRHSNCFQKQKVKPSICKKRRVLWNSYCFLQGNGRPTLLFGQ